MSYVGSSAAVIPVGFSGVNSQSFNGDGSTVAFTLNRPVSAVNAIEVMVNNVQQSPYDGSYSVSSTTLTFSAAPSSGTANIYVVYRDFPVGSITDTGAVQKTGDTMTGNLIVNANVGIGTSSPGVRLAVNGGTSTSQIRWNVSGSTYVEEVSTNAAQNAYVYKSNDASYHIWKISNSEAMRIDSSGNVGIGGAAPSTNKLHIESAGATRAVVYNSSNAVGVRIQSLTGSGLVQTDTNHPLQFATNNGAVQMQIDTAGRVTMPYQPAFAVKEDGYSSYTNGQYAKLDSIQINVGNCYNQSTGLFTAPVAGNYLITSQLMANDGSGRAIYYIYKNGVQYMEASASSDYYNDAQATVILNLQVNDTVGLVTGAGAYYGASGSQNWFCGHLIG